MFMREYQGVPNASATPCPLALPLDCQAEKSDESVPVWHSCQDQALCFGTGVFSLGSLGTHLPTGETAMLELLGEKASAGEGTGTQGRQLGPEPFLPHAGCDASGLFCLGLFIVACVKSIVQISLPVLALIFRKAKLKEIENCFWWISVQG